MTMKPWQRRSVIGLGVLAVYLLGMHTSGLTSFLAGLETSVEESEGPRNALRRRRSRADSSA